MTHTFVSTPLDEVSAHGTDLYLTTHITHKTHAPGGILTRNPSKRASTKPRLRLHGHWGRPVPDI